MYGHALAATCYFVVALLTLFYWRRFTFAGITLAVACVATSLWALLSAFDYRANFALAPLVEALEIVRSFCWAILPLGLLYWLAPVKRTTFAAVLFVFSVLLAALAAEAVMHPQTFGGGLFAVTLLGRLALSLAGLELTENLFRNSPVERRWTIKYLCLGVGILFAYDFYLYSDAVLFSRPHLDLVAARGLANLVAVPLFAIYAARERKAGPEIAISRSFVFHTASAMAAGLYLIAMAAAGYYIRLFGGTWSGFLQVVFFCFSILLLVPLSSGSFRARLRLFVEKSFFKYKYDYRKEWLRFIQTMSSSTSASSLRIRVIEAIGNIVESPDGGLWLPTDGGRFTLAGRWNLSRWKLQPIEATFEPGSRFVAFLQEKRWVIDLNDCRLNSARYEGLGEIPDWLRRVSRAWLVLPLLHRERLMGIIVLGQPRAPRELAWEDFDLLETVGRQVASYLAEEAASEALDQAQAFDAFNKRFAFVIHDIKNLTSQLSLILSNAGKFHGNARFQEDMIETVREAVEKMNRMLRQLHADREPPTTTRIELGPLVEKIVAVQKQIGARVSFDGAAARLTVAADEDRLNSVVEQLVQNAVEAVGPGGEVQVRLVDEDAMAVVEIEDNGPGMNFDFVRDRLFQPFATTKGAGFGIGAYESREFARALGGGLEVSSEPGKGTIMRLRLPIFEARQVKVG